MVAFNKIRLAAVAVMMAAPAVLLAAEYGLDECRAKAAAGDAEAQWQLGLRYEKGDGVRKDGMRALAQYRKAADQKHRKACAKLSDLYERGRLVKRDPVLAAKYKAWAEGGNGELAVAQVKELAKEKDDEIETALDYILGRNGKPKDPKAGLRLLYQQAKDNPTAQRVFVDRWSQGDLDDALDVLSDDEWQKMIPWYKNAWDGGNKRAGLVLGNEAYSRKRYSSALEYWQGSGLAKCWYLVGKFYATWSEEGKGGGPSDMRDETKSRKAFEKCLRIDSTQDDARFALGTLYLCAEDPGNRDLAEAKRIFAYFLKSDADDKWFNYCYGLTGFRLLQSQFDKKWPSHEVDKLFAWAKASLKRSVRWGERSLLDYNRMVDGWKTLWPSQEDEALLAWAKQYIDRSMPYSRNIRDYNRMVDDWKTLRHSQLEFVSYIEKAADLGCEPAREFRSTMASRVGKIQ